MPHGTDGSKTSKDHLRRQRAQQTRHLEHLYREAVRAWEASKAKRTRRRQRKTDGAGASAGGQVELIVDDSHGDPRYLEAARRVQADLARLWQSPSVEPKGSDQTTGPAVFTLTIGDERTAPRAPVDDPPTDEDRPKE